jgi:hypothetical protein
MCLLGAHTCAHTQSVSTEEEFRAHSCTWLQRRDWGLLLSSQSFCLSLLSLGLEACFTALDPMRHLSHDGLDGPQAQEVTTITGYQGQSNEKFMLTAQQAGSPASICGQGWLLLRPPSLACRWHLSLCPHVVVPLYVSVS